MLGAIEKFLFKKFPSMPRWVRVTTYLLFVFLYIYLLLIPRFINGQLVARDPTSGGLIPYRGVEIQLQVEGRDYKFRSNEAGYWSIPVIGRLPEAIEVLIFHEDLSQWFPVTFSATHAWTRKSTRIEIASRAPHVKISEPDAAWRNILARWTSMFIPDANAFLILPAEDKSQLPPSEKKEIGAEVVAAISATLGKRPSDVSMDDPLVGAGSPTYVQKIRIITQLENRFRISIPDEHWRAMKKVGELVDYVEKRRILIRTHPGTVGADPKMSWPTIQNSLPENRRPVFRPN